MKKVTVNITVEIDFDDDYPLATSLEDHHIASEAWCSLAEDLYHWDPKPCWLKDGDRRLSGIAGGWSLRGYVSRVEINAGEGGEFGYALISDNVYPVVRVKPATSD